MLLKLEKLGKEELIRKSSRLLGFMKDVKHESEVERVRLTLLLCYGEVAIEASGTQLLPRLEQHGFVEWVLQQLQTAKVRSIYVAELSQHMSLLNASCMCISGEVCLLLGLWYYCHISHCFSILFAGSPLWHKKVTVDPHILAHIEFPDDRYPKFKIFISEHICIENNKMRKF